MRLHPKPVPDAKQAGRGEAYSREADLIRQYLDTYPQAANRKAWHRQRLLDRQLAALIWIERLLATDPVADDPVSAWFDQPVAERLALADIPTIGALLERIRDRG
ncbi:MAG: phage integrase family protein [Sulfuricellaceae bacterium]|nr:phage integrase family protein [Sulfuricellaceae bacterium]